MIRRGGPDEHLTLSSLHSDLVVIGQRELQELNGYASPEKLLISTRFARVQVFGTEPALAKYCQKEWPGDGIDRLVVDLMRTRGLNQSLGCNKPKYALEYDRNATTNSPCLLAVQRSTRTITDVTRLGITAILLWRRAAILVSAEARV